MKRSTRTPLFLFFFLMIFLAVLLADAYAGPGMRHGMKRSMGHDFHHGMGRAGSGVCPQQRATVQAPDELYNAENPLENNSENIFAGRALFQTDAQPTTCKVCHGVEGNGMGMMANGQNPPPRNFTCVETMKSIPDGQMFWIIQNGSPGTGMPAFKTLEEKQIWQLVLYLRKFAK